LIDTDAGDTLRSESVVLAVPAHGASAIMTQLDPDLAGTLSRIPYVSTTIVSLAYRRSDIPQPFGAFGYIVPRHENRPILACTWTSNKFPHRAPDDHVLIRLFAGRAGQEQVIDFTDEDVLDLARTELRLLFGVECAPVLALIDRWPNAMAQYTLGHLDRLAQIDERLAEYPGLALAGSAYRGVGIPDCIQSGNDAAATVLRNAKARSA
jgi:oxygen-dependent protoporphyrinogen oxidase